jgi:hypothetical protein
MNNLFALCFLCISYDVHDSDFYTIKELEFLLDAQYVSCNVGIEDSMPFTVIPVSAAFQILRSTFCCNAGFPITI